MMNIQYVKAFRDKVRGTSFRQSWVFMTSEKGYLFQPDYGTSILLNRDLLTEYLQGNISEPLEFKLLQRGFADIKGRTPANLPVAPRPSFFMIDLTRSCSNRCAYCFRHLIQNSFINDEVLDQIITYIISYVRKAQLTNITIQPWGGEPLLAWKKITQIQDRLEAVGITPRILIETNGIAITKEMASEAWKRGIKMSISIDGPEEIHNKQRQLYNGQGSFQQTIQGLNILRKYGYNNEVGCVCVITKKSLPHIQQITEFLACELQFSRVKMNMVKDNPVMCEKELCLTNHDIPDFERTLLQTICNINRREYSFGESNIIDRLHNLLTRHTINFCNSRGCQTGKRMLSFGMDGGIYPCDLTDESDIRYGTIKDNPDPRILMQNQKEHFFIKEKNNSQCNDCPWKFFCQGGCNTMRFRRESSCIDSADCTRNQFLYPSLINLILTESELIKSITGNEIEIQ